MECKSYFNAIAPQWDVMRQGFFSTEVRDRALVCAGVQAGGTALDVGAGSGFMSRGLVARGLQVIAVDQSERMLAELAADLPGVDCRVGEAGHLPVDDSAVDFVFANMYLHHVPEPGGAIREMVRVLKPGGMLVITDLDKHDFEFLRREQHDRWLGFRHTQLEDWYRAAGLADVAVRSLHEKCCASSCGCGDPATIPIFIASGRKS
jgi:ubiquinone/menaquinone biosynthesis C-methylase UbiE